MGRSLAAIGLALTAMYAVFAYWLIGDRIQTLQVMPLNEVGDFLAGAFGPLAILWLVLGFFQQGIELRQGTKALLMQAQELKSSVEHQSELVEVSKRQLEADTEAVKRQMVQHERNAEPDIRLVYKDMVFVNEQPNARFVTSNQGPKCEFLKIVVLRDDGTTVEVYNSDGYGAQEYSFMVSFMYLTSYQVTRIIFSYAKGTGSIANQSFDLKNISSPGIRPNIEISKIKSEN